MPAAREKKSSEKIVSRKAAGNAKGKHLDFRFREDLPNRFCLEKACSKFAIR